MRLPRSSMRAGAPPTPIRLAGGWGGSLTPRVPTVLPWCSSSTALPVPSASPSACLDHLVRRMARLIGASVASSFLGIQEYVHDSAAIGHGSELNVNVRSTRSFHAPCMPRSVLGGPLSVRQPNGIPPATWLCWALRTARVVSRVGRYALTLAEPSGCVASRRRQGQLAQPESSRAGRSISRPAGLSLARAGLAAPRVGRSAA